MAIEVLNLLNTRKALLEQKNQFEGEIQRLLKQYCVHNISNEILQSRCDSKLSLIDNETLFTSKTIISMTPKVVVQEKPKTSVPIPQYVSTERLNDESLGTF